LFRLRVARNITEIEALRGLWDSLLTPDLTLFQTHRWNALAARLFGDREEPFFVAAEDENGAAILPAVIAKQEKTISFAGERLFDYRDYLHRGEPSVLQRAWQELTKLGLPLVVTAIRREQAPVWSTLPKTHFSRAPRLSSGSLTAAEFAHSHSRAFSRLRRLERMGLSVIEYPGSSQMVKRIYECRSRQSGPGELFNDQRRVDFMVAVCREEGPRCQLFTLEHGHTIAAGLVTFRDDNCRRFYTIYYDHAWSRYSPGITLLFEVARRSLEQGLDVDLMTGEQSYKSRITPLAEALFEVKATAGEFSRALAKFPITRKSAA
jgi:CelD/BcsL family acetyltransferase involved in cellulose biosynthesis